MNSPKTSTTLGERLSLKKGNSVIVQPTQASHSPNAARRSVSERHLGSSSFIGSSSSANDARNTANGVNNNSTSSTIPQIRRTGSSFFLGNKPERKLQSSDGINNDSNNNNTPPGSPPSIGLFITTETNLFM